MISYSDIKQHANKVRFAIQSNYMPPWPADTNYTRFDNEIILTAGEKEKILNWIENNCPAKDTLLSYQEMIRSVSSREPDLIVRFQQAIYLNGNGIDHFFVVKMPYQLEKDTFVQYVEFVPSQKKLVHHVNGHLLRYEPHRKFNYYKGVAYFEEPVENYLEVYKKMGLTYEDTKENNPKKILPSLIPNTVYYLPGFLTLRY
ncbi:MAG: hypothetical protein N2203_06040, partial [Bacteroidia bacterium]|nr:hypothetical protein [Bacteroidia bacterium]